jgi:hypothetical protein
VNRSIRNVTAVLVITLFTTLAIFATVQLTGRILGPAESASAQSVPAQTTEDAVQSSAGAQLVCPATGCAADSCHATQ